MKRYSSAAIIVACALALAFGLFKLFQLRFDAGDVYPPYSSLRTDPLGTMAFFESLQQLPGINARRDKASRMRLPEGGASTYMRLAVSRPDLHYVPAEELDEIDRFLRRGGRFVITLLPEATPVRTNRWSETAGTSAPAGKKTGSEKESSDTLGGEEPESRKRKKRPGHEDDFRLRYESLPGRWGFSLRVAALAQSSEGAYEPVEVVNRTELSLPATLRWHSGIVLQSDDNAWKTVYARGTNAVIAERKLYQGTLVIATDSYFLSNEAMQRDRHADLLAWLVGPNHNVVFDEAHLGVMETPGMATLLRRYRLYWLGAGLLLLATLFVWMNATSLLPPAAEGRGPDHVAGKESAAGFVNLLRRSIAPRDLLAVCFAEWNKSAARAGSCLPGRIQQAEAIFQAEQSAGKRDPVRAYRAIAHALNIRRAENPAAKSRPAPQPAEPLSAQPKEPA